MKNLRDSANMVRSMARQYQAVIDLAEHVGNGDKLEAEHEAVKKSVEAERSRLKAANTQASSATAELANLQQRIAKKREELAKNEEAYKISVDHGEKALQDLSAKHEAQINAHAQTVRKIDAAQSQLTDLQGSINEKKEELSALQLRINKVQDALSKVA